ncbi:MAG: YqgE/AlgH family protein [Pseudohongiellaceae bacterium]
MNATGFPNSLEDQFLIAMPQLQDRWFSGSVTYIWKHTEEGALGIVVNKPMKVSVADIFKELEIVCSVDEDQFKTQKVLAGGPVERDKGFIIHDSAMSWDSSVRLSPEISICTSKQILQDIADGKGPENYLVVLGCAGWDAGQLEHEILENAWLTTPADSALVYSRDFANKPASAAALLGIDLTQLSPAAGHS